VLWLPEAADGRGEMVDEAGQARLAPSLGMSSAAGGERPSR